MFLLSEVHVQHDLLREFSLHDDVAAVALEIYGRPAVSADVSTVAGAMWEVRATVGMFDDGASELLDHESPR